MIIVDNKYVIAKKELLPKTAQKISFTVYAADYLSNLQGEQQDLPMEEQERPDFATSYSSDPHLDQIEDYALTVIEKGGNLRQLEDVLNRDAFATFLNGDVLTVDDEFFVGNEENFDISPDEDVRRLTGSNLVVGRIKQQPNEPKPPTITYLNLQKIKVSSFCYTTFQQKASKIVNKLTDYLYS